MGTDEQGQMKRGKLFPVWSYVLPENKKLTLRLTPPYK
jgi:hypothetical protein